MPSNSNKPISMGGDYFYERQRKRRPETRTRQRAARWQRTPSRAWQTDKTTSIICADTKHRYLDELASVCSAYPGTVLWELPSELWLITESNLLLGLDKKAIITVCIPFARTIPVRGWGFWERSTWIGPRHTNFPDGSICAFDPIDDVWNFGDSLVQLLDLYTLWCLKHLHLDVFKRWPGPQSARHPYERILELEQDELCGCGIPNKLYRDCCYRHDIHSDIVANAVNFTLYYDGGLRSPPKEVTKFIRERCNPPSLNVV